MPGDSVGVRSADRAAATVPPYTAYVTFDTFIRRAAAEPIPTTIDKSLLVDWGIAAGNESGLVTSLKTLGIVDEAGRPTELYHQLRLSPPRRAAALQRSLELAYPGLPATPDGPIDPNQLHDYFVESRGLTGQMVEKASRFYRQIVAAAASVGGAELTATPRSPASRTRSPQPPSQMRLETIELPPSPTLVRRARSRAISARRGTPPLGVSVQVQVPITVTEAELVDLFDRVQSAWLKSSRRPASG